MNPGTYYVPEGETRHITVSGVSVDGEEEEPFVVVDGSALLLLCTVREAGTDDHLLLKQFGASQLLLAGLNPDGLDPGQEVKIKRWEGGGYDVEIDPDDVDGAADAM